MGLQLDDERRAGATEALRQCRYAIVEQASKFGEDPLNVGNNTEVYSRDLKDLDLLLPIVVVCCMHPSKLRSLKPNYCIVDKGQQCPEGFVWDGKKLTKAVTNE